MSLAGRDMTCEHNRNEAIGMEGIMLKPSSSGSAMCSIRHIPYPYQAMLAICSDLDETPDRHVYYETMRFLNTREETVMGRGLGLEVGNTIYFDMPPDQFAYWNTDDTGRAMVRDLIRSGHIDCLHSYGDLATTRGHVGRTLDELNRHNCHIETWVDHGTAPTNFDGVIMKGSGDVPGSPAYHADLTLGSGVKYIWRGRVTSVIGQNTERNLSGLWNVSHPLSSGKTVLKEFAKGMIGRYGNQKYAMHADNKILRKATLRDGQKTNEFMRCNPHWGGVGLSATAMGIPDILVEAMLQKLVKRQSLCILYTHLGKIGNNPKIFNDKTKQAFSLLARFMLEKKILVTTTRRLLGYCRTKNEISVATTFTSNDFHINIFHMGSKDDLEGLTIYIPKEKKIKIWVNQKEILTFQQNPPDQTGQASISLPWQKMEFPQRVH